MHIVLIVYSIVYSCTFPISQNIQHILCGVCTILFDVFIFLSFTKCFAIQKKNYLKLYFKTYLFEFDTIKTVFYHVYLHLECIKIFMWCT